LQRAGVEALRRHSCGAQHPWERAPNDGTSEDGMKPGYSKYMIAATCAVALALTASPGHAQIRELWSGASHPEDVLAGSPPMRQIWHDAVPPAMQGEAWLYDLHGTAGPLGVIPINGRRYLTGLVCKPHDCGPHNAAFLIALDNSRAAGAFDITPSGRRPRHASFFGSPTPAEQAELLATLYGG
jgi:hypothetical protein